MIDLLTFQTEFGKTFIIVYCDASFSLSGIISQWRNHDKRGLELQCFLIMKEVINWQFYEE